MPMNYEKLFKMLKTRGMKKKDLHAVISDPTIAKLVKGDPVDSRVISAICALLKCDVSDIVSYDYSESDLDRRGK